MYVAYLLHDEVALGLILSLLYLQSDPFRSRELLQSNSAVKNLISVQKQFFYSLRTSGSKEEVPDKQKSAWGWVKIFLKKLEPLN